MIATPGCLKYEVSSLVWEEASSPPQLLETNLAPSETASFSAMPRSESLAEVASTRTMLQFGQTALTMSMSRASSPAQPLSLVGSEVVEPVWLTCLKQPLALVQADRP